MIEADDVVFERSNGIYYLDLRREEFQDVLAVYANELGVGKSRIKSLGTRDPGEAKRKAYRILDRIDEIRNEGVPEVRDKDPLLRNFMADYLKQKKAAGKSAGTLRLWRYRLEPVLEFFEAETSLVPRVSEVTREHLKDYIAWRGEQKSRQGGTLEPSTVRNSVKAWSSVMREAHEMGLTDKNPARKLRPWLPAVERNEVEWLEISEAAKLLQLSREMARERRSRVGPYFHAVVGLFLLTGVRKTEGLGMEWEDVSFEHGEVRVRPNSTRPRLKTRHANRTIPLWPQLRRILEWYRDQTGREEGMLFPSPMKYDQRLQGVAGALSTLLDRAKIDKHVTLKTFRHTYCATRMQTTEDGAPVSPYTVQREMGHADLDLIVDTYGHLQDRRARGPHVEYVEERKVIPIDEKQTG